MLQCTPSENAAGDKKKCYGYITVTLRTFWIVWDGPSLTHSLRNDAIWRPLYVRSKWFIIPCTWSNSVGLLINVIKKKNEKYVFIRNWAVWEQFFVLFLEEIGFSLIFDRCPYVHRNIANRQYRNIIIFDLFIVNGGYQPVLPVYYLFVFNIINNRY